MNAKILFVDDEPNVLAGFARQLRHRYDIETAPGGAEGLAALAARGPFAVVVSDMRMPGMDGARFLAQARAAHPDTSRILLTGYADIQSAIQAVNDGWIFRFLTKPCGPDALGPALEAAVGQYRLVTAERELLEKTLRGSVQVLGEVLALANPTAFERALRVQRLIRALGSSVPGADSWEVDVSAILAQLGYVTVPERVFEAIEKGQPLPPGQGELLERAQKVTFDLLRSIPRLERVTEIIAHQHRQFHTPDGCGPNRKDIPLGARLLKVACDLDALVLRGLPELQAVEQLRTRDGWYDPDLLAAFEGAIRRAIAAKSCVVRVAELSAGMVVDEEVYTDAGTCLLRRGTQVTVPMMHRLQGLAGEGRIPASLRVLIPAAVTPPGPSPRGP